MVSFFALLPPVLRQYCALLFVLLAIQGAALAQNATVSGRLTSPNGQPLENVVVQASGSASQAVLTNDNGEYQFFLPIGGAYSITPFNDNNPLNGVTTFDVVLIANQLNNSATFTSPYQYIAADADKNGLLEANDTLQIRQLILGILVEYPDNTSWRFVPASYNFPNPANPFSPPFPEAINIPNLSGNQSGLDFIGVKIGDINGSALGNGGPGGLYSAKIEGDLRFDANNNCIPDGAEAPLNDWTLIATNGTNYYYASSESNGHYSISVPAGSYTLSVATPNNLWNVCNNNQSGISVADLQTVQRDFAVKAVQNCPSMEVELSTAFLRRCFDNTYAVQYCNRGTTLAEDARVEIDFDPYLSVVGSSLAWTSASGQHYVFEVGDVPAGACGTFYVTVNASCEAELGQTHCSTAHIFPDDICMPLGGVWNGPELEISGQCQNNEVVFTIRNIGGDMTAPQGYVVIEDIMVQMSGAALQLNGGQTEQITRPANGATWRLEVQQAQNFPYQQASSAWVEGCGSGSSSQGIVNLFPVGNPAPFEDTDCRANIGAFDPNDKQGFPLGVGAEHWIPKNTDLEYLIRFQNTGTDTAFTVIIRDTLAATLDLATLRPGPSSHPCQFNLSGNGIAQFVFPQIMLPDSNVNEAASHGFVRFSIRPKSDLPDETLVTNQAGIYFDFNAPIITNRTEHRIGAQYLSVGHLSSRAGLSLEVFPNPAIQTLQMRLLDAVSHRGLCVLYNQQGQVVRRQAFTGNEFRVDVAGLSAGAYYFRLESAEGILGSGRLMVGE